MADFRPEMADLADSYKNLESRQSQLSEKYISYGGPSNIYNFISKCGNCSDLTTTKPMAPPQNKKYFSGKGKVKGSLNLNAWHLPKTFVV